MRIVFMGTPEFAVPSLEILVQHKYEVVGVVTAPDKPAGRGKQLQTSEVKDCALKHGLKILQPEKLKSPEFLEELAALKADLQIVVAFRMLPEVIWKMPKLGTFNLHASLLPKYRGAAPINWAVINGEKETGLTTFFLQQEIDTGNIIFQEKEPILEHDNTRSLYLRLMEKGAGLVLKTVQAIEKGDYPQTPQGQLKEASHAPKIFRETCQINWSDTTENIHNFVRGLAPYPCAWTIIEGKNYKIHQTNPSIDQSKINSAEGKVFLTDNKNYLYLRTSDGWIAMEEIQPEGKKKMDIKAFLAGNKF